MSRQVGIDADGFPVYGTVIDGIVMPDEEPDYWAQGPENRLTVPPARWPASITTVIVQR